MHEQGISWLEQSKIEPFDAQGSGTPSWLYNFHIDGVFQNFELIPPELAYGSSLIKEKVQYLKTLRSNIEVVRQEFFTTYAKENIAIDRGMEQLRNNIMWRENELKNELQKIGEAKVSAWGRQIQLIDDALGQLRRDGKAEETGSLDFLNDFARKIGFVDSGEVKFEFDELSVIREFNNFGKITANQSISIAPKFVIGKNGDGEGEFCRPWGVCTDHTGRILVADRSNHRIQIFSESGNFVFQFGKKGEGPGEFSLPSGVAADKMCRIIVADKDNHRVQMFTYNGRFLLTFGRQGSKPGEFHYPWDVATNSKSEIAVSDTKNHRVQLFDCRGNYLAEVGFGSSRAGLRRLDCPRGLAFWPDNSLLVTDFNNHRILIIRPDFKTTKIFSREGKNQGELFRPQGIACSNQGYFAVSDCKNYRIQVFDHKGKFQFSFGTKGDSPGQFDCPQGICYHPNGNIIVVDFGNSRVQVF